MSQVAAAAKTDELDILEAEVGAITRCRAVESNSTTSLRARRGELSKVLIELHSKAGDNWYYAYDPIGVGVPAGVVYPESAIADVNVVRGTLRKTELRADLHSLEAKMHSGSEPHDLARAARIGNRLRNLEANAEVDRLRDEFRLVLIVLKDRERERGVKRPGEAVATRSVKRAREAQTLCGECERRTASHAFRREQNGDIAKRCRACEFPCCQACGRQRREAEGPVEVRSKQKGADGRKEKGPWYSILPPHPKPKTHDPRPQTLDPEHQTGPQTHK